MRFAKIIQLSLILLAFAGCRDILVPDISDESVMLVSPADSLVSHSQAQHFFWENLEGAEEYNIRIVSPSFQNQDLLVLDSNITDKQLSLTLPFGEYEWNVVAVNSAYSSICCQTFRLIISNDTSSNLSSQTIFVNYPDNELHTFNPTVEFDWEPLVGAEFYLFQIGNEGFSNLLVDEQLGINSYAHLFNADGQYRWRVRGVNETSLTMTAWKEGCIAIDRDPPVAPDIQFPANGDTIDLTAQVFDLLWQSDQDSALDSLYIYNNLQRDILILQAPSTARSIDLTGTAVDQGSNLQDYYWEVISMDLAGNKSAKSQLFRFFVE